MRIAYAMINCNRRDGSARPVNEVAERMAKRGHDVHVYARTVEDLDLDLVKWHRVPGPRWPDVADFTSYFLAANVLLRDYHRYDVIHSIGCNTVWANVITIQNVQPAKMEILRHMSAHEHVSLPRRLTRWLYLRVTCKAEQLAYNRHRRKRDPVFLPVSHGVQAELRRHYDVGEAPVRIIPNAADAERFRPLDNTERGNWRWEQGIPEDAPLAVFAGGEWARKGLHVAIQGIGKMHNKTLWLFVAGDDADRERFKQMARDAGVAERVVFGGFRKDVERAMGSADLFVFPSYYEAFSLATIEAAACGLPIVATKINGTEDFIDPGVTGEFATHDPASIGTVLDDLLSQPAKLAEMGTAARRRVEHGYTWDRVADMSEQTYSEVVSRAGRTPEKRP
jgi:glycosyltransferase involved in cell wall biosynthesis